VGDVFHGRYTIIRKLGWGHFSTVWLSWDSSQRQFVALKMVKSAEHYTEAAEDEVILLEKVSESIIKLRILPGEESVVRLLDHFKHKGPHGTHVCMVFEVLGENLLKIIRRFEHEGIPMSAVKMIARQILLGLDMLHRDCGIIHTDLKPENVLVCLEGEEIRRLAAVALERALRESEGPSEQPDKRSCNDRGSFSEHLKRMAQSDEGCSQSLDRMKSLFAQTIAEPFDLADSMGSIRLSQESSAVGGGDKGLFIRTTTTTTTTEGIGIIPSTPQKSRSTSRARKCKI
jgi:serine/threonine protein kinase